MNYDVIVVGGGHAGLEAIFAASKLNDKVALITLDFNKVKTLSPEDFFKPTCKKLRRNTLFGRL